MKTVENMNASYNLEKEVNPSLITGDEYNTLLNVMGVCFSKHLMDEKLTLLWANDCFYQDSGYDKKEYMELFPGASEYYVNYPEEFEKIRSLLQQALLDGSGRYKAVCRMPVKGGGFHWIRMIGTISDDCLNGCRILYTIYTDVNDMIHVEEKQRKRQDRLQKALDQAKLAKSDFLTRMSHDIRTPMNAILGMTQLAQECAGNPPRTVDCLNKIRLSAEALLSLINDVLDMTKIESGSLTLNRKPFSLSRLLHRLNTIFDMQAAEKGILLRVEIPPSPSAYYNGDELKLERILMNLLGNAVKYTKRGDSILLSVGFQSEREGRDKVSFTVKDTGIGIEPDLLSRIFEPFEKGSVEGEIYGGSGLGLSIAQNYALFMGGTIDVQSEPGKGSVFTLRLSLERTSEALQTDVSPYMDAQHEQAEGFAGKHILLVEDNIINQEIAQCLLEARGFRVDTADNGADGIARFAQSGEGYYYAVIMDIQMPVMDGLEAVRRLRALPRKDALSVPVIAMSANAFLEDVEKSLAAGMNAHISKPFQIGELLALLRGYHPD